MTEAQKFHKAQLEKAVEMARADLSALSPTDRVKLQADLREFLLGGDVHMLVDVAKLTDEETMKALVPIHYVPEMLVGIREMLQWLTVQDGKVVMSDPKRPGTVSLTATAGVRLQLRADFVSSPFQLNFLMKPSKAAAQWVLLYHLKHSGVSADRILLCSRYECKNMFVLGVHADPKRVHYCSVKCAQAAALKVYRDKQRKKRGRKGQGKQRGAQR